MTTTPASGARLVAHLDDLAVGTLKMVDVDGHRICLARTESGVHAVDHACPHEGYGLTQGELAGDLLTCAWHNWKFRVTDGECVLGEEAVQTHGVRIDESGDVHVTVRRRDPADDRPRLVASLRRGIERDYVGQVAREVVRLLQLDANPGELIWEAVAHGAPRAEFGWGHSVASATDCLAMIDLYEGDQRALPLVQGIMGIAESERDRPVNPLPDPARASAATAAAFRAAVESECVLDAQAIVLAAVGRGDDAADLRRWFTQVVSDHHLSYGHGAIYAQKAFYASAVRWHHGQEIARDGATSADLVRLALFCAFLAQWTGRHEWHTRVGVREEVAPLAPDVADYGAAVQRQSLLDGTAAFIVHAHAVKTSRAATLEAVRRGTTVPLDAVARFMAAPKLERFVAATVERSIDFLGGRTARD